MTMKPRREPAPSEQGALTGRSTSGRRAAQRHDVAVIQAEVRRLQRALRPFGVLRRDALERASGASDWRQGGYDAALAAAVKCGAIEQRPFGFYRERPLGEEPEGHGAADRLVR